MMENFLNSMMERFKAELEGVIHSANMSRGPVSSSVINPASNSFSFVGNVPNYLLLPPPPPPPATTAAMPTMPQLTVTTSMNKPNRFVTAHKVINVHASVNNVVSGGTTSASSIAYLGNLGNAHFTSGTTPTSSRAYLANLGNTNFTTMPIVSSRASAMTMPASSRASAVTMPAPVGNANFSTTPIQSSRASTVTMPTPVGNAGFTPQSFNAYFPNIEYKLTENSSYKNWKNMLFDDLRVRKLIDIVDPSEPKPVTKVDVSTRKASTRLIILGHLDAQHQRLVENIREPEEIIQRLDGEKLPISENMREALFQKITDLKFDSYVKEPSKFVRLLEDMFERSKDAGLTWTDDFKKSMLIYKTKDLRKDISMLNRTRCTDYRIVKKWLLDEEATQKELNAVLSTAAVSGVHFVN